MGKRGKAARKRRRENDVVSTFTSTAVYQQQHEHESDSANEGEAAAAESSFGQHEISDAALHVTVATLHKLCGLVDVTTGKLAMKDKRYRSLRKVLYELQSSTSLNSSGSGINGVSSLVGTKSNHPTSWISSSKITREISSQIENDAWELAVATLRNVQKRQEEHSVQQGDVNGNINSQNYFRPKLGAIQRWVRQLDAAGIDNPLALEVLDAILRVVAPEAIIPVDKLDTENASWARLGVINSISDEDRKYTEGGRIRLFPPFDRRPKDTELNSLSDDRDGYDIIDRLVSDMEVGDDGIRRISASLTIPDYQPLFRRCGFEKGEDRKPANHHDLVLVTTAAIVEAKVPDSNATDVRLAGTVSGHNMMLDARKNCPPVLKTLLSYVQGSFLLENVLSPTECDRLIASAEHAGFHSDEPIGDQPGASILAHACVWIVDRNMERAIFERVKNFLPSYEQSSQDQCSGDLETFQPLGLNRRFRFYRYVPGRYYRPHIDGAWPPSGLDRNGNYRYDISDHTNKNGLHFLSSEERDREAHQSSQDHSKLEQQHDDREFHDASNCRRQLSRLTFLIYLNDDFDGGHTTFFVPAAEKEGVLNAFPITPVRGGILVFPHGTCAAPLHEGSPVLKRAKYVVRTEVEYYV